MPTFQGTVQVDSQMSHPSGGMGHHVVTTSGFWDLRRSVDMNVPLPVLSVGSEESEDSR